MEEEKGGGDGVCGRGRREVIGNVMLWLGQDFCFIFRLYRFSFWFFDRSLAF